MKKASRVTFAGLADESEAMEGEYSFSSDFVPSSFAGKEEEEDEDEEVEDEEDDDDDDEEDEGEDEDLDIE